MSESAEDKEFRNTLAAARADGDQIMAVIADACTLEQMRSLHERILLILDAVSLPDFDDRAIKTFILMGMLDVLERMKETS